MSNKNKNLEPKEVRLVENKIIIPNIYSLKRLGAGHDGIVFRYGDLALKLLKYDINKRKEKDLMTFSKVNYFLETLDLKRVVAPIDILLDTDGIFAGYVMECIEDVTKDHKDPSYKPPGEFSCLDLAYAIAELEEDFSNLTEARVRAEDINRGSYIISTDFLHVCDMDKFHRLSSTSKGTADLNLRTLNFAIAKFLYFLMVRTEFYRKEHNKTLNNWVKKSSNSRTFLKELSVEIGSSSSTQIAEYVDYKVKKLTR